MYATYGGTDDNDNSGILTYVRIEYAGIAFQPNNELNSLTLGGVGKGTTIHHIQNSFGGDDAFEWFGGSVDSKFLVAYKTVDDMFDTDFGYTGRNQFSLGISDPKIADVSGSNGFEGRTRHFEHSNLQRNLYKYYYFWPKSRPGHDHRCQF